jgi:hypothetical protein
MPLFTSNKTANYTAAVNDLVRTDCSGGSFTVTMPASPSANDQVGVFLRDTNSGANSNTVTISPNSGQSIFGGPVKLFVEGDCVVFQYQGATDGWVIVADRRQAHTALIGSTSGQTFNQDTTTQVTFNTVVFDNAGLASTANDDITIRRAGRYHVAARYSLNNAPSSGILFNLGIRKNGSDVAIVKRSVSDASSISDFENPRDTFSDILSLDEGDVLTLALYQYNSSFDNLDASTATSAMPRLSVTEVR